MGDSWLRQSCLLHSFGNLVICIGAADIMLTGKFVHVHLEAFCAERKVLICTGLRKYSKIA